MNNNHLFAGEWVEVRSKEDILATLTKDGQLDGLPFMPEMFDYCGKRVKVYKRAHKTCDPVNDCKGRKMEGAVHLDGIRCEGKAYGGCQAGCLVFWKEAWLKRPTESTPPSPAALGASRERSLATSACTETDVMAGTRIKGTENNSEPAYVCQATRVREATRPLSWWDIRQYVEDYSSGNAGLGRMLAGFVYMSYYNTSKLGIGLGRPMRWLYDKVQGIRNGVPYPRRAGNISKGQRTPSNSLDLRQGEFVRVRSYDEILATLDEENKNRGLYFDAEYVPYCGGTFRVLRRVDKILNEKSGKLMNLKTPAVILENVFCQSRYSNDRLFCPRSIFAYWREIWLERVTVPVAEGTGSEAHHICPKHTGTHV